MGEGIPILGVAGRPILHSMSPVLFRELFRASGAAASYTRVAARSAEEALGLFRSLGMRGMNLTAPFKEAAALLVDELTPDARALGAVNSLFRAEDGRVVGANTDPQGALGALRRLGVGIRGKACLVIGAGGAGKAAALALVSEGGQVVVANRTRERADAVAALVGCASAGLDELPALALGAQVIVSTLASDALPDPEAWLPDDFSAAVLDVDYKRGVLARYAAERGHAVATGVDWLVCQALPAYELFMGELPAESSGLSVPALSELLSSAPRAYSAGRKVALIGLMGAGKTQAGKVLSTMLGVPFLDADKDIEADAGMTVSQIFSREGESGFRARERRMLERITSRSGAAVLACGGGAAAFPASAELLRRSCLCVWLHVSPETAAARVKGGAGSVRPLLAGGEGEAKLRALEAERRPSYAACSDLVLSTEGRGARDVAEAIHDEIDRVS